MVHRLALAALLTMSSCGGAAPNLVGQTARPLHFRPEGRAFVVENGAEFFNRPLYGGNTAFRADAGDKPDISLYLPGRGGNLRLGIQNRRGAKWLSEARQIIARYEPGSMVYQIRDPLLGSAVLHLNVQALHAAEGVVARAELSSGQPVELLWAYGGANGERHNRNGDIGTDKVPMSQYFQLKPEHCRDHQFTLSGSGFLLKTNRADIAGTSYPAATLSIADANKWRSLSDLLWSQGQATLPVVVGKMSLTPGQAGFVALERLGGGREAKTPAQSPTFAAAELPGVWAGAEAQRRKIAEQVVVETPDPYINAAVAALNVAADGVWDERDGAFMHGAVAWRSKLLGWRGAYAGDALGWPGRTRRHLMNWFPRQNTDPVPPDAGEPQEVPPSIKENLARNEPALHSNGDLTKSHYDMNLPAIDIFFRHILWTGDLEFARQVWPVIERHLAWERRLFRRPFGPDKLPLYEAYVAIWASDDLQYNGGGVTHASAYNLYHNRMAARVARLIGADATRYEREAQGIQDAMRRELWLRDRGWYGEWKDLLGLQAVHPSAALWTFYHTVDSAATTPQEAWQMSRYVTTQAPRIPIHGPGVPKGDYFTLSTTNWMPYTWSTNNVVMAEANHTALGLWQSARHQEAFNLFKGAILDSMFLGLTPGNVGMCTYFDMARGETQRDFADGVGATSRALIEGLFGVQPDALSREVRVRPGFPTEWIQARIQHPNFNLEFRRQGLRETYRLEPRFAQPLALRLEAVALRDRVATVWVNGRAAQWQMVPDSVGTPRIAITSTAAPRYEVVIQWQGQAPSGAIVPAVVTLESECEVRFGAARPEAVADPQSVWTAPKMGAASVRARVTGTPGHRTAFVRVRQGELTWWSPVDFEVRPAYELLAAENQVPGQLRFTVRNNTSIPLRQDVTLRVGTREQQARLKAAPLGTTPEITVDAQGLLPGTHPISISLIGGQRVSGQVTNWHLQANPLTRWEPVDLTTTFNDRVTQIFRNEYFSPRSPYVSLAVPKHGYGSWAYFNKTFEVNDAGLRTLARGNGNRIELPQGVPLATPGDAEARNIVFTSQWDNYPREVSLPLQGQAKHLYLLMAGSTHSMQSRFDNGEIIVTYADGSRERLALENPTTWWPIDQDYRIDDFAFRRPEAIPPRVDLETGKVRVLDMATFKGKGGKINGGAATVLDLPLQPDKPLQSLTLRTLANEVLIGLLSATLVRP